MVDKGWDFWFDHGRIFADRPVLNSEVMNLKRYHFIMDCFGNSIDFVSLSLKNILGYEPNQFTSEFLMSIIHPDDVAYCMESERKAIELMDKLYFEDHYRFYFKYSYRVRKKTGDYIFIKQSYQAIEIDERGHMSRSLVFHEVAEDDFQRKENDFTMIDRMKNRPVHVENHYDLSKREVEVLDLIVQGKSSKEIAECLFISEHTVNTHRKKILAKTTAENFLELRQRLNAI
ncbi:LuxR C-terminal-related transcriptional regulator [Sphingobacterium yanglingense]|uniref:PAS domain-containing protein n=1 Tax=Sphingobacterium yanglingense TaxID=1437280 RepID=A0A4R6WGU1_9SPHI|nr:LuxR C-terminal-related transcriptional regulator [Sphingobacterium yanglingense]TDQ76616.1 PAS domain-containing protein [Sphingobacterium yanglingense]